MQNGKFNFLKSKILSSKIYPEFFPFKPDDIVINVGCGEGPQAIVYSGKYKKMVGVDIGKMRLKKSREAVQLYRIKNFIMIRADVERMPLVDNSFDKAILIDIIEHVKNPRKLCFEVNRLLKENGELLVTFPAMHDKFIEAGRFILRGEKRVMSSTEWDPDAHNYKYKLSKWISIVESCGFKFHKSRASTLFPPLHFFGIPKFWFSNKIIHYFDNIFCKIPILKNYGQSLVCIFIKRGPENFSI